MEGFISVQNGHRLVCPERSMGALCLAECSGWVFKRCQDARIAPSELLLPNAASVYVAGLLPVARRRPTASAPSSSARLQMKTAKKPTS